jgi:hypothetical protein
MEYQAFDNMMDICQRFGYDTKRNPHHDPINKNYLSSKSYFVLSEKITPYKKLKKNQLNYPLRLNSLSPKYFRPHFRYDNMSKEQRDLILAMIDIEPQLDNFFLILNKAYNTLNQQKEDMRKQLDIRDIDVRIKIAIIYNDFRSRFPNLYGNIDRFHVHRPKKFSFFEIYTNDKGEEVYFMKFFYNTRGRTYIKCKTESGRRR